MIYTGVIHTEDWAGPALSSVRLESLTSRTATRLEPFSSETGTRLESFTSKTGTRLESLTSDFNQTRPDQTSTIYI